MIKWNCRHKHNVICWYIVKVNEGLFRDKHEAMYMQLASFKWNIAKTFLEEKYKKIGQSEYNNNCKGGWACTLIINSTRTWQTMVWITQILNAARQRWGNNIHKSKGCLLFIVIIWEKNSSDFERITGNFYFFTQGQIMGVYCNYHGEK